MEYCTKEIPDKIRKLEEKILITDDNFFVILEEITREEIRTRIAVSEELNEFGKPKFSNEQRRADEVWLRLHDNINYMDMINKRRTFMNEKNQLRIEKEYWNNTLNLILKSGE